MQYHQRLRFGASAGALMTASLCAFAAPAHAQEDRSAERDVVVVTAQKREEAADEIPLAISTFTAEDRNLNGIITTQDIANLTPGMSISDSPNRVSIRGIGRVSNELGSDPGVANYVDGFYTSESDVIGSSDFLTERVEVMRGPQGTLYGRNSIGGAVNVISRRPTADFQTEARYAINDYQRHSLGLSVSGPLLDNVRYRLVAIGVEQGEGYAQNLAGVDQWTTDTRYVEAQLEVDLSPDIEWWLKVSSSAYDNRPRPDSILDPWNTATAHGGLVANPYYNYANTNNVSARDPYTVAYDYPGHRELNDHIGVTTHLNWDLGQHTLRYVGGYSQYDFFQDRDFDQTARASGSYPGFGTTFPVSTNYVEVVREDKKWESHEINLISDPDPVFDWILGLYTYSEEIDQPYDITVPDEARFNNPAATGGVPNPLRSYYHQRAQLESESWAGFATGTYRLTPAWSITGGLRYTEDKKSGSENQFAVFYNVAVDPSNTYTGLPNQTRQLGGEWGGLTGNVNLAYAPSRDLLAYATISRGYKSGGFKLGGVLTDPEVDEESVVSYEAGLKLGLGPDLQWNSAVFHNDYEDLQVPVPVLISGIVRSAFVNVPKSHSSGFETELTWTPLDSLRLRLVYARLDAEIDRMGGAYDVAAGPAPGLLVADLSGNRLPQSPENKLTLNVSYEIGDFLLSATSSWIDEQYYSVFTTDRYRADAYNNTNIRGTWISPDDRFRLSLGVSNLFDETSFSQIQPSAYSAAATPNAMRRGTPNLPRIVELELQARF